MERALIVNDDWFKARGRETPGGFGVLYYGDEFCQVKIPGVGGIKKAAEKFPGKKIILLTSVLTQKYLKRTIRTIREGFSGGCLDEVVVNDIGLLHYLVNEPDVKVVINVGRVLVYTLGFSLRSPFFIKIFKKRRIDAFEADSLDSFGYLRTKSALKYNLHAPYRYLAQTRFCGYTQKFNGGCDRPCGDAVRPVISGVTDKMFLKGNVYLKDNSADIARIRGGLPTGRIKRLVFCL